MYKKLIFICIVSLFPLSLSARVSMSEADRKIFEKNISTIVSIGKILQGQQGRLLVEKIFEKRKTLMQDTEKLYTSFELRALKKPTLDISSRYNLTLQKYKLSCEIAALRMAIESIEKKYISEDALIALLPQHKYPMTNDRTWGDPDIEFVGSYTGSQRGLTGYGIYEKPLFDLLGARGIYSEFTNSIIHPQVFPRDRLVPLLDHLSSGASVILWGDWCTNDIDEDGIVDKIDNYILRSLSISARNTCDRSSDQRVISWTTRGGKNISALSGEHAFLLLGYIGPREKPSHIIVWDTDTGKHIYRTSEWMRKWSLLDYRSLIIFPEDISGI